MNTTGLPKITSWLPVVMFLFIAFIGLVAAEGAAETESKVASARRAFQNAWYQENALRKLPEAIALYKEVAEAAESKDRKLSAKAYVRMGICYERLGKKKLAVESFRKAIRLSPVVRGDYMEVVGQLERSDSPMVFLGELPETIQKAIGDHYYYYYEDSARLQKESLAKAIETYRRAVEVCRFLGHKERAAYTASFIGDLHRHLGRFDDALQTYQKVQREFPKETAVLAWNHIRLGETYRLLGKPSEAIKSYGALQLERYKKQVQPRLWAKLWLGDCYRAMNEPGKADDVWNELLSTETEPPLPAKLAAMLLGKSQTLNIEEPEDPFSNDVAYFLAVRAQKEGNGEAARELFQECISLSQGHDWPRPLAETALESLP